MKKLILAILIISVSFIFAVESLTVLSQFILPEGAAYGGLTNTIEVVMLIMMDLMVKARDINEVHIYFGGENISFEPDIIIPIEVAEAPFTNYGDLGDINGDGRNDILVNEGGDMNTATVYYMETNANEDSTQPILTETSNYPNPFSDNTTFEINLNKTKLFDAKVQIFNIKGQKIREIPIEPSKDVIWDVKDQDNGSVPSGVYLYRVVTQEYYSNTAKMLYLKQ